MPRPTMRNRSSTVSYTHLDVYKRQDMFGDRIAAGAAGARLAVDDGAHDRNDRDRGSLGFGRVGGDPVSVSYTHLDVYKRQVICR